MAQTLVSGAAASSNSSSNNNNASTLDRAEQGNNNNINNNKLALLWDEQAVQQRDMNLLVGQLQTLVNVDMSRAATTPHGQAVTARYQTILADLRSDIDKTSARIRQAKERQELMSGTGTTNTNNASRGGGGGMGVSDPAMEHLLRERNHIGNSMLLADNVLGQADNIRSDLRNQGRSLRNTGSLLHIMTTNVPGLGHLVEQIRRRRSRDDYIVAGVISSCVLLTLWYIFG